MSVCVCVRVRVCVCVCVLCVCAADRVQLNVSHTVRCGEDFLSGALLKAQ